MNTRQFCSDKLPRQSRLQSIERVWSSKLFMDIDLDRSMPPAFAMKSSELPGIPGLFLRFSRQNDAFSGAGDGRRQ